MQLYKAAKHFRFSINLKFYIHNEPIANECSSPRNIYEQNFFVDIFITFFTFIVCNTNI